ncbi:MAG: acyl carrier protein [Myxococcota bacterium]
MTEDQLIAKLITLAAARFKADAAQLEADQDFFASLGIDSFQAMELMTDLEEEFDVEIPDYELQGVTTFRALAGVLSARL